MSRDRFRAPQAIYGEVQGCQMSRWTFPSRNLWPWPLHSRLSWASLACRRRLWLVSEVGYSHPIFSCHKSYVFLDAMRGQIILMVKEVIVVHMRRQTFSSITLTLAFCGMTSEFGLILWFDYTSSTWTLSELTLTFSALYPWISMSRYPRAPRSWPFAPTNQGCVQRSPCNVGGRLFIPDSWRSSSLGDHWRYWSSVSRFRFFLINHRILMRYSVSQRFLLTQAFADSQTVEIIISGQVMIQKRWWRSVSFRHN